MKKIIVVLLLCCSVCFAKTSVLIVGGGPAGLAAAIEAKMAGCEVTVVEKRKAYERPQVVFLDKNTLQLFKKWGVAFPADFAGIIRINALEQALDARREALHIPKINASWENINDFPYDILIGADGAHSRVREVLGIPVKKLGSATGIVALEKNSTAATFSISDPIFDDGYFIRNIDAPGIAIVFMQSSTKKVSVNILQEKTKMKESFLAFREDIPILLQQAETFSNKEKSAIIIGDAAAVGSFFQGTGANTAFKAAEIAGKFLKNRSYSEFNESMQKTTDALIQDNLFLFP